MKSRDVSLLAFGGLCAGALLALIVAGFVGFVAWHRWDSEQNRGFTFGYYGQFNRVKHVIEAMPNVSIVDHWQHKDISLEDFGFTLRLDDGREVVVTFLENSPQKNERDKQRLKEFIQKEIDSGKAVEAASSLQ